MHIPLIFRILYLLKIQFQTGGRTQRTLSSAGRLFPGLKKVETLSLDLPAFAGFLVLDVQNGAFRDHLNLHGSSKCSPLRTAPPASLQSKTPASENFHVKGIEVTEELGLNLEAEAAAVPEAPSALSLMIAEFLELPPKCDTDDAAYATMESLEQVIESAASAPASGPKNTLVTRNKQEKLDRARPALLNAKAALEACTTFDELLAVIEKVFRGIEGLGGMYTYDTARRIGAYLKLFPRRVYLNSGGTREGARALKLDYRRPYVNMISLPAELRKLEPKQVEEFLNVFKDRLVDAPSVKWK